MLSQQMSLPMILSILSPRSSHNLQKVMLNQGSLRLLNKSSKSLLKTKLLSIYWVKKNRILLQSCQKLIRSINRMQLILPMQLKSQKMQQNPSTLLNLSKKRLNKNFRLKLQKTSRRNQKKKLQKFFLLFNKIYKGK